MQLLFFLSLLFLFSAIVSPCYAGQEGCCSHHSGICGNSCCDGTAFSLTCNAPQIYLADNCKLASRTEKNIDQALMYISDAQELLFHNLLIRDQNIYPLARVFDLFELAERELQYALEKTMNASCRNSIKDTMAAVRESKDKVVNAKREFEAHVKKSIQNQRVTLGMTKINVKDSWGSANNIKKINRSGQGREIWEYKSIGISLSPNVYLYFEKLPYFDNEILTSIKFISTSGEFFEVKSTGRR